MAGPAIAGPLDPHRWERRLLIVFADSGDDPALADQRARIAADEAGFDDRRLLLITVIGDDAQTGDAPGPDGSALRQRFGVARGFTAVLVGLDGGEKARTSTAAFTMSDLFAQIDRMPMRRRELRERGG